MNIAIVTTTINDISKLLESYYENILTYNHLKEVTIYIAGDRKSSKENIAIAEKYNKKGFSVKYLTLEKQYDYLVKYKKLDEIIPENSDNRRNVAFLMAFEEGADILISIDDDNYPLNNIDFITSHKIVGNNFRGLQAVGENGWYNLCSNLYPNEGLIFPRGFPYSHRTGGASEIGDETEKKIAVNVGLWIGDPDVDAITRLSLKPRIESFTGGDVILGYQTRTPINTQNTALSREAIVSYYYVKMGEEISGLIIDRFGDIFSGYFLQMCVESMNQGIKIGDPILLHTRNQHNIFYDLYNELAGIVISEDLADFIRKTKLKNTSYYDAYVDLTYKLENYTHTKEGFLWGANTKDFFKKITINMRIWADVINENI